MTNIIPALLVSSGLAVLPPNTAPSQGASEGMVKEVRLPVPVYREIVTHLHRPPDVKPGEKRPCVLIVGGPGCKMAAALAATHGIVCSHFSPTESIPVEFRAWEEGLGHAGQDAIALLLEHLAALPEVDRENTGLVTFSFGIVGGSGALARHPELQVKFLVDWEGPSGPQNVPWVPRGHKVVRNHPAADEAFWKERTASEFIKKVRCRYLRVQAATDHVQVLGRNQHGIEMLNNAAGGLCPWTRCNDNPPNILYDAGHPENEAKQWLPGKPSHADMDKLILKYIGEMAEMPPLDDRKAGAATRPLPVYVYLFAHYEDHINIELSEWRIKEVMGILAEAHRAHPGSVAAVGEFYGADSGIFQQRNRESGIVDIIRRAVAEGWYDLGYHGAHEPTYATTQQAVRGMTGRSWREICEAARSFYTSERDLKTGAPDPSRKGGAAMMQEVFGPATVISGAAGAANPPGMQALADFTGCRVYFGFTDHGPAMFNRDYIPAVLEIRKAVSPAPETSPDVFWFMGCLITSSHPQAREVGVIGSDQPPEAVAAKFQRLDRSRVAVPHMMYGSKFIYARASPTEYAYGGDRNPAPFRATRESRGEDLRLPAELLVPEAERKQKIENFRRNLDWLLAKYFPVNPGSRCVGNRALIDLVLPYAGDTISLAELDRAADALLHGWTSRPPNFVSTGDRYLTLAQTFKLLVTALKSHSGQGAMPATFRTDLTYGPIGTWPEVVQGPEGNVDAEAVIAAAARIEFGAERQPGDPDPPANRVPLNVAAGGRTMHAAQFLRLIAETYQALRAGKSPGALRVRPGNLLPPLSPLWLRVQRAYDETPAAYSYLQLWTVKPAQFKEAMKR